MRRKKRNPTQNLFFSISEGRNAESKQQYRSDKVYLQIFLNPYGITFDRFGITK